LLLQQQLQNHPCHLRCVDAHPAASAGIVLWLLQYTVEAASNLRREALQRGVDTQRLVFADRMPNAAPLARHTMADLFLDT
jgi:predicted O-linked N-acetylglucosamine transferase (SPINDLY family)